MGERLAPLAPLAEITRARLRELVREPGLIFWVFGFPVVMAIVLGLAFRTEAPESVSVAVGGSGEAATRTAERLEAAGRFAVRLLPVDEAAEALRTGEVDLVVEPATPGSREPVYTYRFDPTRPTSRTGRLMVDDTLQRAGGREDVAAVADVETREPGARYIDFLIPGLIGLNLMGSGLWGVGFGIVMMRTRKLLKRFAATPMRRSDFLLGLILSRLVLLVAEVAFLVVVARVLFDVTVHGSIAALAVVSVLGSFAFTGIALVIAARVASVEVASGLMNLLMIPMWLFCGAFFSYHRFPEALHPVIRLLPLTAVIDALRSIMNEGAPLLSSWSEMIVLAGWTGVSFVVALRTFRWQ